MLKPLLNAGLSAKATKKILISVILPAVLHGSHLWDPNISISIYTQIKEILRIPYNPPAEALFKAADITPTEITQMLCRINIVKQLASSGNLNTVADKNKSKLYKLFLSDIKKFGGRNSTFEALDYINLKPTSFKNFRRQETARKWSSFIESKQGYDGLYYLLSPESLRNCSVPMSDSPRTVGAVASLFTGHCNLQLHKYKLGMTYTPTCACLHEDESVKHHVFSCGLYNRLRTRLNLSEDTFTVSKLVEFSRETNCLL